MRPETPEFVARANATFRLAESPIDNLDDETVRCRTGWQATMYFYAALFWAKAYFHEHYIQDVKNHGRRLRLIQETPEIGHLEFAFHRLQDISFDARYKLEYLEVEYLQEALRHYTAFSTSIEEILYPPELVVETEFGETASDETDTTE